jgi:hypothetical protein
MTKINWDRLAQVKELQSYFADDFSGFQHQIEQGLEKFSSLSSEDLDKLAILRALEVTNGCTQWAHRRKDEESLPLEQTRQCMKLSMSAIKNKQINLKNGESITFSPFLQNIMDEVRSLYIDAFKHNLVAQEEKFYALSTAQFLLCGSERMKKSFQVIRDNYQDLFTDFYINKGIRYVQSYLDALE